MSRGELRLESEPWDDSLVVTHRAGSIDDQEIMLYTTPTMSFPLVDVVRDPWSQLKALTHRRTQRVYTQWRIGLYLRP